MKKFLIGFCIFEWVGAIFACFGSYFESHNSGELVAAIVILVVPLLILYLIKRKKKNGEYSEIDAQIAEHSKFIDQMTNPIRGKFKHIRGLNIAGNTQCEVLSYPSEYQFVSGAVKFKLAKSKVIDVSVKGDVDVQNQYVSSVGGAVVGGALFGTLGAAIGGRAKKKQIRTASIYLIITYKDDENVKYIIFDGTNALIKVWKFANEFKKNNTSVTNIEL